jgi:hypothetical protein
MPQAQRPAVHLPRGPPLVRAKFRGLRYSDQEVVTDTRQSNPQLLPPEGAPASQETHRLWPKAAEYPTSALTSRLAQVEALLYHSHGSPHLAFAFNPQTLVLTWEQSRNDLHAKLAFTKHECRGRGCTTVSRKSWSDWNKT